VRAWFDGKKKAYVLVRDQAPSPGGSAGVDVSAGKSVLEIDVLIRNFAWRDSVAKGLCADAATRGEHCCGDPSKWCDDPTRFNRSASGLCYCGMGPPCGGTKRCLGAAMNGQCKQEAYSKTGIVAQVGTALAAVSGSAADDVWAVGARGAILHYDGATWRSVASGVDRDLRAVLAVSKSEAWAAGAGGTLVHWDGKVWSAIPNDDDEDVTKLARGSVPGEVIVISEDGAKKLQGKAWQAADGLLAATAPAWRAGSEGVQKESGGKWTTVWADATCGLRDVWLDVKGSGWAVGSACLVRISP
jgi:hypothetical protein